MKKIELLAPAGNMDALIAAVQGGANAVYLGGTCFSARAFAGNFSHEDLIEAVTYCHVRGVKVYVTMNTLLFEDELENAMKEVAFLYEHDIDALLVQDYGLFYRIRSEFPDFEVHASTQMHVHNVNGCKFLKEQGAKRVVLARETSLETIQECCKTGVEIEVFAYGAICISYSGQCLFSQVTKNRSGNRGMCAQCCRMKYKGLKDGEALNDKESEYLLSPKDLNAISLIPQLMDAGVSSLKIEGRMKRPEYVYLVTKTFREAIDSYANGQTYEVDHKRLEELMLMFNRGFSKGHINHDSVLERMNPNRPNHQGIPIGKVISTRYGYVQVLLDEEINQQDGLRILTDYEDIGITANKIEKNGLLVNHADARDIVWLTCPSDARVKANDIVLKTTDVVLVDELQKQIQQMQRTSPIEVTYKVEVGKPLLLEAKDDQGHVVKIESEQLIQEAIKAPITQEKLEMQLLKVGEDPYEIVSLKGDYEPFFMPISKINETRRNLLIELSNARAIQHKRLGKQEVVYTCINKKTHPAHTIFDGNCEIHTKQEDTLYVNRNEEGATKVIDEYEISKEPLRNTIIRENGNFIRPMEHCIAGMSLNISNSYGLAFVYQMEGIDGVIFSSEVTNDNIKRSLDAFEGRYGFVLPTYRLVEGRRILMQIKDDFTDLSIDEIEELHGQRYPIYHEHGVTQILESEPYTSDNPYCYGDYILETKIERN